MIGILLCGVITSAVICVKKGQWSSQVESALNFTGIIPVENRNRSWESY